MAIDGLAAGEDRPARAVTVDCADDFELFYRTEYASVVRVAYALVQE
ncbi:hypothetical protein BH20ACT2_BH20ACT2_23190 [soil metagenome]